MQPCVSVLLVEALDAELLDVGLLDLRRHPGGGIRRRVNDLHSALEDVDALCTALSELDLLEAASGSLQGGSTGLLAGEDVVAVLTVLLQNKVLDISSHDITLHPPIAFSFKLICFIGASYPVFNANRDTESQSFIRSIIAPQP